MWSGEIKFDFVDESGYSVIARQYKKYDQIVIKNKVYGGCLKFVIKIGFTGQKRLGTTAIGSPPLNSHSFPQTLISP